MDDLGNRTSVNDRGDRDILYAADIVNAYESVGAVGWWKMNESSGTTTADGSGNAQDGTLNNFDGSQWVAGQTGYGNALEFDGTDDYVSIPSDTEFVFPDEYTYAVWIKPDNVTTSYQPILNRTTSSIWQMGFWLSNSQLRAYTHYSGDDAAATSVSGVITAGQWQHVAVVHKGGKNYLYVNGQEVSYATQTQATGTKTTYPAYGFVMGTGLESVQRYFNGCLDDVLIFNTALSAHAIEALYLDVAGTGERYYAHDAAGNLIRDDRGYRYSYDYENRLSKVEKPDGAGDWQTVATFEYVGAMFANRAEIRPWRNALGRRIRKVDAVASTTTLYYYDPDWRCLEERDGSEVLQRSFIYGNYIDEVLVMSIPGSPPTDYYTLHDHLYSPAARSAPASLPANNQFLRPIATIRSILSARLLSISRRGSSTYRVSAVHCPNAYVIALPIGLLGRTWSFQANRFAWIRSKIGRACSCRAASNCVASKCCSLAVFSMAYKSFHNASICEARTGSLSSARSNFRRACAWQPTSVACDRRKNSS